MRNGKSKFLSRSGSLAAACGAAMVLVVVLTSAATIVKPLPSNLPTGTIVSSSDHSGVNLLEPANTAATLQTTSKVAREGSVERVVGEWTPTGGGSGGGGSPKG